MTKFIEIKVNIMDKNEPGEDIMSLKVNINDSLQKLIDILSRTGDADGLLLFDGKIINEPKEKTFRKLFIRHGDTLLMYKSNGKVGQPLMWKRFGEMRNTDPHDYYYLHTRYWDAVTFIPKREVVFHGFGVFSGP